MKKQKSKAREDGIRKLERSELLKIIASLFLLPIRILFLVFLWLGTFIAYRAWYWLLKRKYKPLCVPEWLAPTLPCG